MLHLIHAFISAYYAHHLDSLFYQQEGRPAEQLFTDTTEQSLSYRADNACSPTEFLFRALSSPSPCCLPKGCMLLCLVQAYDLDTLLVERGHEGGPTRNCRVYEAFLQDGEIYHSSHMSALPHEQAMHR